MKFEYPLPGVTFLFGLFDAVVACTAESLPIGFIPEQLKITTVRNTMIDHSRGGNAPLAMAVHTQRIS